VRSATFKVNLVDKHHRSEQSHAIATRVRPALQEIGRRFNANVKVVEVPPGPPVQAPIVAEIYGPEAKGRRDVAKAVRALFDKTRGCRRCRRQQHCFRRRRRFSWSTAARPRCSVCRRK
jgi:multidrug efflux pump subunit AcrB